MEIMNIPWDEIDKAINLDEEVTQRLIEELRQIGVTDEFYPVIEENLIYLKGHNPESYQKVAAYYHVPYTPGEDPREIGEKLDARFASLTCEEIARATEEKKVLTEDRIWPTKEESQFKLTVVTWWNHPDGWYWRIVEANDGCGPVDISSDQGYETREDAKEAAKSFYIEYP